MSITKKIAILMLTALLSCIQAEETLTPKQIKNLNISYNVALEHKKRTGNDFTSTICSMQLVESDGGMDVIGDNTHNGKKKPLFKSSLGSLQMKVPTAYWVIASDPYLRKKYPEFLRSEKFEGVDDMVIYDKYTSHFNKMLEYSAILRNSSNKSPKTVTYAKKMLLKERTAYISYMPEINRDRKLMKRLLSDVRFSTEIALGHLNYFYEVAQNQNSVKPLFRTVSRYNGGWNNKRYYSKVQDNGKIVRNLIKSHDLVASTTPRQFLIASL